MAGKDRVKIGGKNGCVIGVSFNESELTNWDISSVKNVEKWGDVAALRNASLDFMMIR